MLSESCFIFFLIFYWIYGQYEMGGFPNKCAHVYRLAILSQSRNSKISYPNSYKGCRAWDALHTIRMGE